MNPDINEIASVDMRDNFDDLNKDFELNKDGGSGKYNSNLMIQTQDVRRDE